MISYNFISIWTLFKKEVYRFLKVGIQTVIGPAISSLLFLTIFTLALGRSVNSINGVALAEFIAPGLIMMTMLQNSFANSASSIGQAKFQGNIVDILMAPLGDFELTIGYIGGSIARGLICGIVTAFGISLFLPLQIHSFSTLIFYSFIKLMIPINYIKNLVVIGLKEKALMLQMFLLINVHVQLIAVYVLIT